MIGQQMNLQDDHIVIRGRRLGFADLIDPAISDGGFAARLRGQLISEQPFPHLCLPGLFNPVLLELVLEEFDHLPPRNWRGYDNRHEKTFRSHAQYQPGPAARLYFWLVNSTAFVDFLAHVTGVDPLIADTTLLGGGLHESRNGGHFGIHRDFDRHLHTGLHNEMVVLTYLNRDWDDEWGGALELWDAEQGMCRKRISPEFGLTVLMRHGPHSYHGHPQPMQLPQGRTRRSLASYYYSQHAATQVPASDLSTLFLQPSRLHSMGISAVHHARRWAPPVVWDAARRLRHFLQGAN